MPSDSLTIVDNRTGRTYEIPIQDGTIRAADLRQIKAGADEFGLMSYDPAFLNTAACRSAISYIDGDRGILRYRGYPIEELAERSTFLETAYLLLNGELPKPAELDRWAYDITHHTIIHENVKKFIDGFHHDAHPMGMFVSTVAALSTFYPEAKHIADADARRFQIHRLIAKTPTLAAFAHRHSVGMPYRLSRQRPVLRREFPQHDVQGHRGEVQAAPGAGEGARRAVHPARRPRAELLDERDARRRLRRTPTPIAPWPPPRRRCTVRCTAAPTKKCCGCCARSAREGPGAGLHRAGEAR